MELPNFIVHVCFEIEKQIEEVLEQPLVIKDGAVFPSKAGDKISKV